MEGYRDYSNSVKSNLSFQQRILSTPTLHYLKGKKRADLTWVGPVSRGGVAIGTTGRPMSSREPTCRLPCAAMWSSWAAHWVKTVVNQACSQENLQDLWQLYQKVVQPIYITLVVSLHLTHGCWSVKLTLINPAYWFLFSLLSWSNSFYSDVT